MRTYLLIFLQIILLLVSSTGFAETIIIHGNFYINRPTTFKNKTLDMRNGRLILQNNATLTLVNSTIETTISPINPFAIYLLSGHLTLENSAINVVVNNITPNPMRQSIYYIMKISKGSVTLENNKFYVNKPFTVGLLTTEDHFATSTFKISNNQITNFHGGIYLLNNTHSTVHNNHFDHVSAANIFNLNNKYNVITNNEMLFAGNLHIGNGIDVYNSENITIDENIMYSNACYAMFIQGSKHIKITNNEFYDGITYAIFLYDYLQNDLGDPRFSMELPITAQLPSMPNQHIEIIHNYVTKNRYAFAGGGVDDLTIANNFAIHKFNNSVARQFWTNTDNIFHHISHLTWKNNLYKEAYDQNIPGDNSLTNRFYLIPERGGLYIK